MDDSKPSTLTPFRVARRSPTRSSRLTWAPAGDLAHGLLEAMSAAPEAVVAQGRP